ncbi:MAG: hypothetical protein APR54_11305 [Candidatus Cloacimonas sp. SDB]|nr:MAG: hypothetical protein APR54_11305 [Candidatus Cloacimonas sp. SDB]
MKKELETLVYMYSSFLKRKYGMKVFRVGLSTGLTCPHRIKTGGCIFCHPATFTGEYQSAVFSIEEQLNKAVPRIKKTCGAVKLLAYFQDETSTAGELVYLDKKYRSAVEHPDIIGLIVSTRPEYVNQKIIDLLKSYNVPVTIEIGLQTAKEESLKFLNRGHDLNDVKKAINLCEQNHLDLGVHIIIGIPGETIEDMQNTIQFINSCQTIKEIKFHNLVVYKQTPLAVLYQQNKFKILNIDEYISILCQLIPYLRGDIVISRFFTSNIRRTQIALGDYSGSKPEWLNKLRLALIQQNIFQGCKTGKPYQP